MFAPDASAAGSEAKALQRRRAEGAGRRNRGARDQVVAGRHDQIVLANDGALRWTRRCWSASSSPGDDVLRPRVRIVADEHLTGPARELVQTRLDLWLKTHIEKLLAPLFSLTAADDVTGMARGVAFQLVEALGVLERQKVAEEVKGLDQPARATLRKYGVRFGAYHIYLPILLKPAPRALATQLWALKHEAPDAKGVDDLLHLAASGRTSFPVDKETPKPLYRTAGYRVCGERAVRVDILERLADLIRPALSWREGAPTPKPDGAFDGRGFTVTGAMTSLTGASGEDFASILRSLGYRMDRRPKPPEPAEAGAGAAAPTAAPRPRRRPSEAADRAGATASAERAEVAAHLQPEAIPADRAAGRRVAARRSRRRSRSRRCDRRRRNAVAGAGRALPERSSRRRPATPAEQAEKTEAAAKAAEPGHDRGLAAGPAAPSSGRTSRAVRARRSSAAQAAAAAAPRASRRRQRRRAPTARRSSAAASRRVTAPRRPEATASSARSATSASSAWSAQSAGVGQRSERRGGRSGRRGAGRAATTAPVERAEREQYYAKPFGGGGRPQTRQPDPNSPFAKLAALKAAARAEATKSH